MFANWVLVTDYEHSFWWKNERTAYEATVSSLSDCGLCLRYEKRILDRNYDSLITFLFFAVGKCKIGRGSSQGYSRCFTKGVRCAQWKSVVHLKWCWTIERTNKWTEESIREWKRKRGTSKFNALCSHGRFVEQRTIKDLFSFASFSLIFVFVRFWNQR